MWAACNSLMGKENETKRSVMSKRVGVKNFARKAHYRSSPSFPPSLLPPTLWNFFRTHLVLLLVDTSVLCVLRILFSNGIILSDLDGHWGSIRGVCRRETCRGLRRTRRTRRRTRRRKRRTKIRRMTEQTISGSAVTVVGDEWLERLGQPERGHRFGVRVPLTAAKQRPPDGLAAQLLQRVRAHPLRRQCFFYLEEHWPEDVVALCVTEHGAHDVRVHPGRVLAHRLLSRKKTNRHWPSINYTLLFILLVLLLWLWQREFIVNNWATAVTAPDVFFVRGERRAEA